MITNFYEHSNKDFFYYIIVENKFLICDFDCCSKSERTFDIRFDDLVINKELQEILFSNWTYDGDRLNFAKSISSFDKNKINKLITKNPKLRILVQNPDLFIDVLGVFNPDDIRVKIKKYNL